MPESGRSRNGAAVVPAQDHEAQPRFWLAAYTRSRHEQQVAQQFQRKNLGCLLPTFERLARWSDRVKRARAPLFPGYVFVQVSDKERAQVLETVGVVNLVSRAGKAVTLSQDDIAQLQACCLRAGSIEPHPYLKVGRRVRVKHGPFSGWEGTLVEKQNSRRLVITIEQIMKAVAINIDGADVEALN
ncbi:MAG TPA: UpxY family transcription antiterminator [Candidatus Bathyarchaeia archaeon]|nr:UpxY family transcription antiterminator [Candidatus Bathyarchaeia archaeon]